MIRAAAIATLILVARGAIACGAQMPAYQILMPTFHIAPNYGLGISAPGATSWGFDWYGADPDHVSFNAQLIDLSGGPLSTPFLATQWANAVQVASDEVNVTGKWYPTEAPLGGTWSFSSTGQRVAVRMSTTQQFWGIVYIAPGGIEGTIPDSDFVISTEPVPAALPDVFENVFCSAFDPE